LQEKLKEKCPEVFSNGHFFDVNEVDF